MEVLLKLLGQTKDNRTTNKMVGRGQLPRSQKEIYPQIRTQEQIRQAPFRMFEDQSFQGNPRQFLQQNPRVRFYEDNSFTPDNQITNRLVQQGQLPQNQMEVYPQGVGPYQAQVGINRATGFNTYQNPNDALQRLLRYGGIDY
jgi:hypothetical protein